MTDKRQSELQEEIAKKVKELLDEKNWSMSHFSILLGKSKSHVSRILSADMNLTLRVISEMEEVLGKKILDVKK